MSKLLKFALEYILTMIVVVRAYTIGVFFERYRYLIHLIADTTKVSKMLKSEYLKLEQVSLADMVAYYDAPIAYPVGIDGNIETKEIIAINHLLTEYKPKRIFEIGTFNGRTTLNLALNSPEDAEVFTLDLPDEPIQENGIELGEDAQKYKKQTRSGQLFYDSDLPEVKKITHLFGDSAAFDFSPYNSSIDFIFIDGSHQYDYIHNDTKVALKLLRGGKGIILWHDYNYQFLGVARAINELSETEPLTGMRHIAKTSLVYTVIE